jgi:acyl-CoA synthetase (NDP forming)
MDQGQRTYLNISPNCYWLDTDSGHHRNPGSIIRRGHNRQPEKNRISVALKACSPDLMHKSEAGVIELGLKSANDVAAAYERIMATVSIELEGILVQEMVPGMRELVFGMSREPQFGPCVMIGLGGVMTEILNDAVFRVRLDV